MHSCSISVFVFSVRIYIYIYTYICLDISHWQFIHHSLCLKHPVHLKLLLVSYAPKDEDGWNKYLPDTPGQSINTCKNWREPRQTVRQQPQPVGTATLGVANGSLLLQVVKFCARFESMDIFNILLPPKKVGRLEITHWRCWLKTGPVMIFLNSLVTCFPWISLRQVPVLWVLHVVPRALRVEVAALVTWWQLKDEKVGC